MPSVDRTATFNASIENIFSVLKDFRSYPEFVEGVEAIEILEESATNVRAEYSVNMVKEFKYILNISLNEPNSVSWELESGDLFKKNNGHWNLKKISDNKTEVTYGLEVEFKGFAPKMIVNKLVKTNLPSMMKSFQERAEAL